MIIIYGLVFILILCAVGFIIDRNCYNFADNRR